MSNPLYRVIDWEKHFEGAKSKTYNNKTSCSMPCKHGLGYKRLIRQKNGPAMFGAWCALIQILSRHNKERRGYCTDTGLDSGNPYTAADLEMLSDIPETIIADMLEACTSEAIGWMEVVNAKELQGYHADTMVPLNLDSDSNLNSNLDSDSSEPVTGSEPAILVFPCTGKDKEWNLTQTKLDEWQETYATIDVLERCKVALQWVRDNSQKRKTARGMPRFLSNWMARDSDNPKVPKRDQALPAKEKPVDLDPAQMYYDWDGAGVQTFENRYKVRHADFADRLRVDLADLSKQKFTQKYHQTPDGVRGVLEAWNY